MGKLIRVSDEGKLREFITYRTTRKESLKERSLDRKEMIKEEILAHKEGRKKQKYKNKGNYTLFSFFSYVFEIVF
jgi:hypothetical protein